MSADEQNGGAQRPQLMTEAQIKNLTLNNFCWPVIISGVNGIRVAMIDSGMFDVGTVLERVSEMMGRSIGGALSMGDLGPILQMRAKCKEAFIRGMSEVKPQPAPNAPTSDVRLPSRH